MRNRIRELRKSKKLTLKQLGKELGVAESTVSHYETGKRQLDNETLLKLGEFFNVPVGYILGVEEIDSAEHDILDDIDVAFYGDYKELTEDDKETLRAMARVMRERRAKREQEK